MSQRVIAVTGATGNIGAKLTELLLAGGHTVRAIARGGERLQALAAKGAEAHAGSVTDATFLSRAFAGADAVFAMVPPNYAAEHLRDYQRSVAEAETEALATAGVPRVVALSSIGAQHEEGTGPIAGLHDFEGCLAALGAAAVVSLRPALFMENFLQSIPLIRGQGINGSPVVPDLPVPMIATRDIAAAAAEHLAQADGGGKSVAYLLGSRDLTFTAATRILGEAIGRPDLPYVQFAYEDTRQALLAAGLSPSVADGFVELYRGINEGLVRATEPRSSGNTTPTALEAWSATFAAAYRAAG